MAPRTPWDAWLDEACARVRFKPDRPSIRAELTAHLEDGTAERESAGYPRQEAETMALAAMGDAAQVGDALDRAHSPLLGRLWLFSGIAAAAALLFTALFFLFGDGYAQLRIQLDAYGSQADALAWMEEQEEYLLGLNPNLTFDRVRASEPAEAANGYRFTVEEALLWGAGGERTLYILLRADRPRPWSPAPDEALANELWAVSSSGGEHPAEPDLVDGTRRSLSCRPVVWDLASNWYCIALRPYSEDEWVELYYPFGENDWAIRLTLPGGDGA